MQSVERPPPLLLNPRPPDASEVPAEILEMPCGAFGAIHVGRRFMQEDRLAACDVSCPLLPSAQLYVVIDGHGGSSAPDFCREYLPGAIARRMLVLQDAPLVPQLCDVLTRSFIETERALAAHMDAMIYTPPDSGACVLALLLLPHTMLIASAGDCRALIVYKDGTCTSPAPEHTPSMPAEYARVQAAGFGVLGGRVGGVLAVSRSVGDFDLKRFSEADASAGAEADASAVAEADASPVAEANASVAYMPEAHHAVSCVPTIVEVPRDAAQLAALLLTDGVYEVMPNEAMASLCTSVPLSAVPSAAIKAAIASHSCDNLSCIALPL